MGTVTARGTGASGLATPAARWALVAVWLCGIATGLIDGTLLSGDVRVVVAYALMLWGLFLLTDRREAPLSVPRVLALAAASITTTIMAIPTAPATGEVWLIAYSAYLLALAAARGNAVLGLLAGAAQATSVVVLGTSHGWTTQRIAAVLVLPLGAYVLSVIWRTVLHRIVRRERAHRSAAAAADRRAEAGEIATRRYQEALARVRTRALPVLSRLRDGIELTAAEVGEIGAIAGTLRDEIRAPALQHPRLDDSVGRARRRGVDVLLLASLTAPRITGAAAVALAALLDVTRSGQVVISVSGAESPARISFVHADTNRVEIVVAD